MENLNQHTQKMQKLYWRGERLPSVKEQNALIEIVVAETLAWAEEQVVPDKAQDMPSRMMAETDAYNECRAQIINSFKEIQGL